MKILAIRLARLGDVILLLPALAGLKSRFPNSHLTFLTGSPCEPMVRMCPAVDEILAVDRVAMRDGSIIQAIGDIGRLIGRIRSPHFDLVIDFHGLRETNALTGFSGAPRRMGLRRFGQSYLPLCFNTPPVLEDKSLHASRMPARVIEALGARPLEGTHITIPEIAAEWRLAALPSAPLLVLYLDAPALARVWPAGRFSEIARRFIEKDPNVVVVALTSPAGEDYLADFLRKAPRSPRLFGFSNLPLSHVAAAIGAARLLISNDTGPMHLGPALGTPTLGLFSAGLPEHFAPTGPQDRFLQANPIDKITVETVLGAAQAMWKAVCNAPE